MTIFALRSWHFQVYRKLSDVAREGMKFLAPDIIRRVTKRALLCNLQARTYAQ